MPALPMAPSSIWKALPIPAKPILVGKRIGQARAYNEVFFGLKSTLRLLD